MFLIRRAKIEDVPTLLKLAKMVHFINLPVDRDIISGKVLHSRNCFIRAAGGDAPEKPTIRPSQGDKGLSGLEQALAQSPLFMFVLEDTESGSVLGTSQIVARMGGPGNPNVSFKLSRKEFFSQSLQLGNTHIVAKLFLDESSPTEIGGLILQPSYRSHKLRIGRFLSIIRFHFMALHRGFFADRIIAEMMARISPDGHNLLWEYLGRRFINLSYTEADRFCQYSREFMTALLPREEIYLTLLPPEARAVVGEVGPETVPARRLLERLGFQHRDFVDPFDGGPHLEAVTDDIPIVRQTSLVELAARASARECDGYGMVSLLDHEGDFRAVQTECRIDRTGRLHLPKAAIVLLQAEPGARLGFTPLDPPQPVPPAAVPARRASRTKGKGRAR